MNGIEVVTVIDWKWHLGYPGGEGTHTTVLKDQDELPLKHDIMECLIEFWPGRESKAISFKHLQLQTELRPSEGFIEVCYFDEMERPINVGFEVRTALLIRGALYQLTPF